MITWDIWGKTVKSGRRRGNRTFICTEQAGRLGHGDRHAGFDKPISLEFQKIMEPLSIGQHQSSPQYLPDPCACCAHTSASCTPHPVPWHRHQNATSLIENTCDKLPHASLLSTSRLPPLTTIINHHHRPHLVADTATAQPRPQWRPNRTAKTPRPPNRPP